MGTRYSAYVLRHWHLSDGQERVEVQQIATGESRRYHALADAYGWITAQSRARAPTSTPAQTDAEADMEPRSGRS
ncbi:MAG: hypothetical protein U0841_07230 [Chloroflexia bacterium]